MTEDLQQERNRLANRAREQLWRYYPQALAIGYDLAADWFLESWAAVPTPSKAARTRESTVERVLRAHRIRRITAAEVLRTLRQPALTVAAGTAEAAGAHIRTVAERLKLTFAERQTAAIRQALACKVLVITGGPGVGKTTIVKGILRILSAKGVNLLLCAPTGRAAKRMTEATGFEAKTIHRLLEADPQGGGFKRGDDNPLDCDLLVVDETSMVDVLLMQALLKAVPQFGDAREPRWRVRCC